MEFAFLKKNIIKIKMKKIEIIGVINLSSSLIT